VRRLPRWRRWRRLPRWRRLRRWPRLPRLWRLSGLRRWRWLRVRWILVRWLRGLRGLLPILGSVPLVLIADASPARRTLQNASPARRGAEPGTVGRGGEGSGSAMGNYTSGDRTASRFAAKQSIGPRTNGSMHKMRYCVDELPSQPLPAGRLLVHNNVRPARKPDLQLGARPAFTGERTRSRHASVDKSK
jgi:hypothetical protein